jgi:hypothetical protein
VGGVLAFYRETYGNDSAQVRLCDQGMHHEPHVAEAVFVQLLKDAGVSVFLNTTVLGESRVGIGGRGSGIGIRQGRNRFPTGPDFPPALSSTERCLYSHASPARNHRTE